MIVDRAQRERAVSEFSTSFSVEASAGTGKTTLLSTRFARLLEEGRGTLSSIVAITFTEKAAFELKHRIALLLGSSEAKGLGELKDAYVSTIHAFAARILREKSLECGLDPEFTVMDPLTTDLFLKKRFYRWLADLPKESLRKILRAVDAGIRIDRLFELGRDLYAHRDLLAAIPRTLDEPDLRAWLEKTAPTVETLWERAQASCVNPHDAGFEAIESLQAFFQQARGMESIEKAFLFRLAVQATKGSQKDWNPPSALKDQKEALRAMSEEVAALRDRVRAKVFSDAVEALCGFVRAVEDEKNLRSWIDFDDLLFRARDLLRARPDVLDVLRAQFSHLLIDEYQDTDPIQAEIVWRLASTGHEQDWRALPIVPGKLFFVGDPKQSIYRFRKASIETYRATTARLVEQGERLVIAQNFRSSAGVVERVNAVFSSAFQTYESLVASPEHAAGHHPAFVVLEPRDLPSDAASIRANEAAGIAGWVHELLENASAIVWDRSSASMRPAKPGDVAVLFPTTTGIDAFEEAFRERGVPFALDGGSAFFHRLEIHGFLSVLRAILEPREPVHVVAALKSSFFGVSDAAILSRAAVGFDDRVSNPDDDPVLAHAMGVMREVRASTGSRAVEVMERALEKTFAVPVATLRFHGEQAAANLLKLVSMARHLEGSGIRTLRQFLSWVDETLEGKAKEGEALLSEEDREHVRFLTIHGSKGLEFPIVILANLSKGSLQPESVLCDRQDGWIELGLGDAKARFCTPGYESRLESEKTAQEDEKTRLLYVAMTRAKDVLAVSKFVKDAAQSPYWRWIEAGLSSQSPAVVTLDPAKAPSQEAPSRPLLDARGIEEAWKSVNEAVARHERDPAWQAFSSQAPLADHLEEHEALRLGVAFHRVVESMSLVENAGLSSLIDDVLASMGLSEHGPTLRSWCENFFSLPVYEQIRSAKAVHREVPFAWRDENGSAEGTIDLVFKGPGGWTIVDFKTDREPHEKKIEAYRSQLEGYKAACERILQEPVVECVLAFVQAKAEIRF